MVMDTTIRVDSISRGETERLLGRVLMTHVTDKISVPLDAVQDKWAALGLPSRRMPKPRPASDAFRLATGEGKVDKQGLMLLEYDGKAQTGYRLTCVLTYTTDDEHHVQHQYTKRAVIGLDDQDQLQVEENLLDPMTEHEKVYVFRIRREFERLKAEVTGNQLRSAINNLLADASAVRIHTATYVVPNTQQAALDQVEEIVRWMNTFGGQEKSYAKSVEFGDVPEQREQLRGYIRDHINREIEEKIARIIRNKQATGKIGERQKSTVAGELVELRAVIEEYEKVLAEPLGALKQLLKLQEALVYQHLNS